jgi:uncharacterized protein (TIGR02588 family)
MRQERASERPFRPADGHDDDAGGQAAGLRPALSEWIAAGIGVLLLLGAIGQLLFSALDRDETPPDIELTVQRVTLRNASYVLSIRASNQGGATAAEIEIEGTLDATDGTTEISRLTLDYLPPRSEHTGGLVFSNDPNAGNLALRVKGFVSP